MISTNEILQGKCDENLDLIEAACRQRRKLLRGVNTAMTMATVQVGDTVRIKGISPKYMVGMTGKVHSKGRTRLEIKLSEGRRRFDEGQIINVPSSCVEIV